VSRRQPARLAPHQPAPVAPACDARLGFGLFLAFAMAQRTVLESSVVIDLSSSEARAASPGLVNTLCYCREHRITGDA
jgi:hypothetical protein